MQVHRLEPVQITCHHARRNLQAAAQRNADMRKIPAHARALLQRVQRIGGGRTHAVAILQVFMNPAADFGHLRIAGQCIADDLQCLGLHLVRRAIAALPQVVQHVGGHVGHQHARRAGGHFNLRRHFHDHLDRNAHLALGHGQALAQVAVAVHELGHWHPRLQVVAVADDPLRLAVARAQHGHQRAVRISGHAKGAGGFELHGEKK